MKLEALRDFLLQVLSVESRCPYLSDDDRHLGVFMDRIPEPNKISVRVPEISGREEGDPYPNRKLSGTRYRVPDNFSSGYWVTNNPITTNLLFAFFLAK